MAASDNNVRAVERALQILNCFAKGKSSYTLMELAREISLSPSTTLRLIGTLENNNYLYRDEESLRYYLGFKLARISGVSYANLDVCRVARPFLKKLNELFDESVGLYIVNKNRRVCVERVESNQMLRRVVQVGDRQPLTRGASGRVLLSFLREDKIRMLLEEDPYTSLNDLRQVREQRYAVSHGEREAGIVSVAAPIFDARGLVAAALFITGPSSRIDADCERRFIQCITEYAGKISEQMGYVESDPPACAP